MAVDMTTEHGVQMSVINTLNVVRENVSLFLNSLVSDTCGSNLELFGGSLCRLVL